MLPTILILAVACMLSAANPEADPADEILRSEIESAAKESRALADELAAMLARLEAEEDREEAVEAAVVGDNKKVKEALTEMVDKIEELAEASEVSNLSKLTGAVKNEKIREEELKNTLEELEIVASQIEEVASSAQSSDDINAIETMAELLQSVSDKVEEKTNNIDSDNEKSTKEVDRESKSTSLELNGIDEMIKSLEKVTHDLRELNVQSEEEDIKHTLEINEDKPISMRRKQKALDLESSLNQEDDASKTEEKNSIREPKELDIEKTTEEDNELDEYKESKNPQEKIVETKREPKELEEPKEGEECTEKEATNRVRVCVPKFSTVDNTVHLYSGEVKEERHCYDVTKTICQESSQIVSKEVCVYSYNQKTVVAPAQMTEVTFQRRQEKLAVTKCTKEKIQEGYKEKVVEVCKQDYVEAPYTLPSVAANINEFIEMSIPEPEKNCQTFRYEIPEVTCKDVTTRECTELVHVDPVTVTEYLDTVQMDYKGKCGQRVLKQQQQVCTMEQTVKRPKPSYQG